MPWWTIELQRLRYLLDNVLLNFLHDRVWQVFRNEVNIPRWSRLTEFLCWAAVLHVPLVVPRITERLLLLQQLERFDPCVEVLLRILSVQERFHPRCAWEESWRLTIWSNHVRLQDLVVRFPGWLSLGSSPSHTLRFVLDWVTWIWSVPTLCSWLLCDRFQFELAWFWALISQWLCTAITIEKACSSSRFFRADEWNVLLNCRFLSWIIQESGPSRIWCIPQVWFGIDAWLPILVVAQYFSYIRFKSVRVNRLFPPGWVLWPLTLHYFTSGLNLL